MLPTDSPRTDHLCVNVDGLSDDRAIELDISASVGVKARCCHSPGFYPGLRYHSFSTVGSFKVQVSGCMCVCMYELYFYIYLQDFLSSELPCPS